MAVTVVELARLGLREDFVRLRSLAEPHLCLRVLGDVRVQLTCKAPERLLDLPLAGPSGNA